MKTVIITEKPSVAREVMPVIEKVENQSFQKRDGYYESNDFYLTWCFGHLVTLADPSEYGWSEWNVENLPMIPENWKYSVKNDSGAKKQFNTIKSLLSKSDTAVNLADPDREGELIFRLVIHLCGQTKMPQERMWNRSLTFDDLKSAWTNRSSGSDYNNLYSAANCRQRADWLIGMNLSRAYSLRSGVKGLSIGRVQTPTLKMIVDRDLDIENWKQSFYSILKTTLEELEFSYVGIDPSLNDVVEFISDTEKVNLQKLFDELKSKSTAVLNHHDSKKKLQYPKVLYNLADLQKDANSILSMSAQETLATAQSLYEKKILTYPRTDCNYLTDEMYPECKELLGEIVLSDLSATAFDHISEEAPKSFNSKKVTAHTAIVPTTFLKDRSSLSKVEADIYQLVLKRFVNTFGKPKQLITYTSQMNIDGHYFKNTTTQTLYHGYENIYGDYSETTNIPFPKLSEGESYEFKNLNVDQKERTKPKRFTEASIISAMQNCSRTILDEELKDALNDAEGIGTPATRASIIESLKKRGYILLKKKSLISTDKGRSLISAVVEDISSPKLTANWEKMLSGIEDGSVKWADFYNRIVNFTKENTTTVLESEVKIKGTNSDQHKCPKCNETSVVINKGGAFCQNEACNLKLFRSQRGSKLTDASLISLLTKGNTRFLKFKNKQGKEYKASIVLDEKWNLNLKFKNSTVLESEVKIKGTNSDQHKCPKCNETSVVINKGGAFCQNEACNLKLFRSQRGSKLTDASLISLLTKGNTRFLKFKNKQGKEYKASIVLDEKWNLNLKFKN